MQEHDDIIITDADEKHLDDIQKIYACHVTNGTASWEYDPPDLDEIRRRFDSIKGKGLPYLVALKNGTVAGYSYANHYRPREGYRFTVEDTIYIHPDFIRQGIGRLLLKELITRLEKTEIKNIIAVIGDTENTASIRLHESLGFIRCGTLPKVGFKFGRWLDSVLLVKHL